MALRGKRLCDLIARETGALEEVGLSLWRYDVLSSPTFAVAAVHTAEHADFVVVASKTRRVLPAAVSAWLHQWPKHRKPETGALVAVFDPVAETEAGAWGVAAELRAAAANGRMDFFCDAGTSFNESKDLPEGIAAEHRSAISEPLAPAGEHLRFCSRGYGIDE